MMSKKATTIACGIALAAAAAPAADAKEWSSFLNDVQSQSTSGGALRVVLADQLKVTSSAAPMATVRVSGSARAYFPTGTLPPYIKLVDKLTFTGAKIKSVTVGSGGWSMTGGSSTKTLSYTKTLKKVRNNGHVYRNLTMSGALRKVEHRASGSTTIGPAGVSVQAYDSCGVFSICH